MPAERDRADHPPRSRAAAVAAGLGFVAILAVALAGAAGRLGRCPPRPTPPPARPRSPRPTPAPVAAPPAERFTAVTARLAREPDPRAGALQARPRRRRREGGRGRAPRPLPVPARPPRRSAPPRAARGRARRPPVQLPAGPGGRVDRRAAPRRRAPRGEAPRQLTTEVARVAVTIESSLYESLQRSGEDPNLAVLAADVLAWDVDFYQDVRAGDRMRMVVEKVFADGKLLRYGEVLAAEYDGAATGRKRLFRYTDADRPDELLRRGGAERAARLPQVAAQVREHHLALRQPPPPGARLHARARGRRLRRADRDADLGGRRRAGEVRPAGTAAAGRRSSCATATATRRSTATSPASRSRPGSRCRRSSSSARSARPASPPARTSTTR